MKINLSVWMAAASACLPLLSAAQTLPPLAYRSAFADYKPYEDVTMADWRAVNDAVAPASEAAEPAAAGTSSPVPAPVHRMQDMHQAGHAPMGPMHGDRQ